MKTLKVLSLAQMSLNLCAINRQQIELLAAATSRKHLADQFSMPQRKAPQSKRGS
jgi:hypothetical protein